MAKFILEHLVWVIMLALAAPFVLVFTPWVGMFLAALPRWLGRHPGLWDDDARVLWVECAADGCVEALVYDADEYLFGITHRPRRHWVRRWEHGRGIVWEQRAALTQPDVAVAAHGCIVFATLERELCAVDARTGALRWRAPLPLTRLEPVLLHEESLVYEGDDPESGATRWVQLSAVEGKRVAEGQGDREGTFIGVSARDDASAPERCELLQLPQNPSPGTEPECVLHLRGDSHGLRHPLGPAHPDSEITSSKQLGPGLYAVRVTHVQRPPERQTVTLLVDVSAGRVLADFAALSGWVVTPGGKRTELRL
ncbi:MAG: hypothetical protein ABW321_07375 [Polyangiales bacterium]